MRVITIGRDEANDKVITDPCTSRHHLQIIQHDDGHFTLSDFGSTNGTYVNGQKISGEIPINDMDIVRIGNTTIPWRMYFDDPDLLNTENNEEKASSYENQSEADTNTGKQKTKNSSDLIKLVIGMIIGFVLILGGLCKVAVLRGTDSSLALVIIGTIVFVFNTLLLVLNTRKKTHVNK